MWNKINDNSPIKFNNIIIDIVWLQLHMTFYTLPLYHAHTPIHRTLLSMGLVACLTFFKDSKDACLYGQWQATVLGHPRGSHVCHPKGWMNCSFLQTFYKVTLLFEEGKKSNIENSSMTSTSGSVLRNFVAWIVATIKTAITVNIQSKKL